MADSVSSKTNILHIRYFAHPLAINSSFSILYTAYRDKTVGNPCNKDTEYDCEDETCIAGDLRCNHRVNCRFRWDEEDCPVNVKPHFLFYFVPGFLFQFNSTNSLTIKFLNNLLFITVVPV